jgi:hypothetical protein
MSDRTRAFPENFKSNVEKMKLSGAAYTHIPVVIEVLELVALKTRVK